MAVEEKKCGWCGAGFSSNYPNKKYCCHACYYEAHKKLVMKRWRDQCARKRGEKKCGWCGETFAPTHGLQKYCSKDCCHEKEMDRQRERRGNPEYAEREREWRRERRGNPEYAEREREWHRERMKDSEYAEKKRKRERERARERRRSDFGWAERVRKRDRERKKYANNPAYKKWYREYRRKKYASDPVYRAKRNRSSNERKIKKAKRIKRLLWDRQHGLCGLCLREIPEEMLKQKGAVHIDHARPKNKGGTDELDNLQLAHPECNIKKSDRFIVTPFIMVSTETLERDI